MPFYPNRKISVTRQTLIAMKLVIAFLIMGFLQASAKSEAQHVTISGKNMSLEKVFESIQKQTPYVFFYDPNLLRDAHPVTVSLRKVSVIDALNFIFNDQPLSYKIVGTTITVVNRPAVRNEGLSVTEKLPQITISGRVTDNDGKPLEKVSIVVKGTSSGTATDANGTYHLSEVDENATLIFSIVGYITQTVSVNSRNIINISLKIDVKNQSEVVVIAYGTTQKKDLTGSVSTVDPKQIQDVPFATVDNAIAGKAAGVQVTKSDGTPGGAVKIRVRGSTSLLGGNDPLYVIDGVPIQVQSNFINPGFDVSSPVGNDVTGYGGVSAGMSTAFVNGLNSVGGLNIDDIESITILKDASSTAIYGSKAANGVVIITTKRGKKDMKPQIMFSYYNTFTKPINPKLLNGDQYRMLLSEAAKNDYDYRTAAGRSISAELNAIVNNPDTYFGKANTPNSQVKKQKSLRYAHGVH